MVSEQKYIMYSVGTLEYFFMMVYNKQCGSVEFGDVVFLKNTRGRHLIKSIFWPRFHIFTYSKMLIICKRNQPENVTCLYCETKSECFPVISCLHLYLQVNHNQLLCFIKAVLYVHVNEHKHQPNLQAQTIHYLQ